MLMTTNSNSMAELTTTMLDHMPILAAMINAEQVYLHVNQPFADFHRNTKEFFIGKKICEILPEESYNRVIFPISRVLDGEAISFENNVVTKDGSIETFLVTYTPINHTHGRVELFLATMENITQQRETEQELSDSLAFTNKLVDASPVGILFLKPDGEITYENPAMLRIMGVPEGMKSMVIGKNILELPPIIACGAAEYLRQILEGKPLESREFTYSSLVGKTVDLEAFGAIYRDRYQRISGAIILVLDISDRKKPEGGHPSR